ncbi:MAG: heme lyase CcmF/NrfE family subunit [Candidatus Tectomicrobia bacterium]|nr:heme lyase CcmF/NrfE family subunit [Candidatus Tectomicrobia bacterium]
MPTLGSFSIALSLLVSVYAGVTVLWGAAKREAAWVRSGERAVWAVGGLLTVASILLIYAFWARDFRLAYVASYSSRDLPLPYTLSAFYAGQDGSLLFWVWMLSLFAWMVVHQNRRQNRVLMPWVVAVLMGVVLFFLAVLLFLANPFRVLSSPPADGQGLNPLLQNPGMFFHPPTLYLGYVGFTVPFAFAMAALITRRLDADWIRSTRRWTLFSWFFLAVGNLFGAQWAYLELGWGGYWMWDPVESASFMPWLTGTAYLHSVMIQEKKGMLKVWNMSLIIITFALSVFGTFLTRSGILSSVHSFAQSSVGPVFLSFLAVVLAASLTLLFSRMDGLRSVNEIESLLSRESSFLFNNLLLVGAAFAVFWGTVFPLVSEAVRGVKITVGPPFYNRVTIPIFLALLLLTGICPLIAWRKASSKNFRKNFLLPAAVGLAAAPGIFFLGVRDPYAFVSFTLSVFVAATIFLEFHRGTRARAATTESGYVRAFLSLVAKNKRRYGGYIIHIGLLLIFVGVSGRAFTVEKKAFLNKGESMTIRDYTLTYQDFAWYPKGHMDVAEARLAVFQGGAPLGLLKPERNFHRKTDQPTTEVAIRSTLKEDLYVILAALDPKGAATFQVLINPLVIWIWIGGGLLSAGTLIAMWPDRKTPARPARPRRRQAELVGHA